MNHDLTFITNEKGLTLKDRFTILIKDAHFFDCLVGYFYTTGFYSIYKSLENAKKIRILVGISVSKETFNLIKDTSNQSKINFSHLKIKETFENQLQQEIESSEDNKKVEEGIYKFIEWIQNGKLEIRAYPSQNIHAKLYIITFTEGDRDIGRVITGSSNLTQAGLEDNLEFNVELKNRSDYEFAKQKFEELWKDSVDVSEKCVQTVNEKTWLNQNITPYELYLKLLYEYFKEELSKTNDISDSFLPEGFKEFEYQKQAVLNAKRILEEYGGVFISDVVGLGKTYITALLVKQLDGRTIVIAPPALLSQNNPGSWNNVFSDFNIPAKFISIGKPEDALQSLQEREYKNIIIDEAHRFRNANTITYALIAQICRGRRVILVSATPYNNSPQDILSQIKLFQNPRKSVIPGIPNLQGFFTKLQNKLLTNDKDKNYEDYLQRTKEIAKEIRDKVLRHIMIRRTRTEIEKYFSKDLQNNNIKFPVVEDPKQLYYQLNEAEDEIFMETVNLLTKKLTYARYSPLLYLKSSISDLEKQSQKNLSGFMKVLLIKRLESSFYAFRNSINRFIESYEKYIREYNKGNVYVSKKYINKIFELIEQEDEEAIQKLIEEEKAEQYSSRDFKETFKKDLEEDLKILGMIKQEWEEIKRDPKLETLISNLKNNQILKDKKIIIFTESKETAEYLEKNLNQKLGKITLVYTGESPESIRKEVINNFDAKVKNKKDDYRILISTEVLSEGVNLHRSNIVINYDIPWNPTRLMQRVGRINRVDTNFDKIYIFNFFPTAQANDEIQLTEIARSKIETFLHLLGGDAAILTEGEPISSHELFNKLISKESLIPEELEGESELKYLKIIEDIRDNKPDLFEKIKRLPKKARAAKKIQNIVQQNSLITFFRKGKLMKFFLSNSNQTQELDFLSTAKIFECSINEESAKLPKESYYELLDKNKTKFLYATQEDEHLSKRRGGKDNALKLIKIIKATQSNSKQQTEEQEEYLKTLLNKLEEGAVPDHTIKQTLEKLHDLKEEIQNPLKVVGVLQQKISANFLKSHYIQDLNFDEGKREVILSMYLVKEGSHE